MARRLGTSRCSVILPNETRRGANALDVRLVFAGREAAKMRPSEDLCCRTAVTRAAQPARLKLPKQGRLRRETVRKTAQTSSVAERLTAVEPYPKNGVRRPRKGVPRRARWPFASDIGGAGNQRARTMPTSSRA